jgi:AcrR family transcriptional regulator
MMNMSLTNRNRLLFAARELFLKQGYDASVDAIICRAEVARQTFYNHFKTKELLFAEVVRDSFLDILAPLNEYPADLRQSLLNFGSAYRARVLSPDCIAAYRILSSQSQRFPELVREVYALGAGQMIERLADFLATAMEQNFIHKTDSVFAAELLMAMLVGQDRTQLLFGVKCEVKEDALNVITVVDGFLKMYACVQKNN